MKRTKTHIPINKHMKKSNRIHFGSIAIVLAIITILTIITITSYIVFAVDNDEWTDKNSARVYLNWMPTSQFGGLNKRNYIFVYAFEGDTITLGSNIYNAGYNIEGTRKDNSAHNDDGSVDIVLYDLKNQPIPIDIHENGEGHIKDVETEKIAKNLTSYKGNEKYKPITYTVNETGIYTVEFRSYGGNNIGDTKYLKNKNEEWPDPATTDGLIAAWDISVFDENDEKKPGRTFANYLSLQTAQTVRENYYVLTNDNYIYKLTFNGINPWTYNIFANNRGIIDNATGNILYKSVKDIANNNDYDRMGVTYQHPGGKETEFSKNFQIFFEEPSKDLEGYLYEKAFLPEPATNVHFVGSSIEGNSTEIIEGMGGYFAFDVTEATTATLRIEFNNIDGKEHKPVEISDAVKPYSTNYFKWDGKDGDGNIIPANEYDSSKISYSVTTKAGEVHFPIIDMEYAKEGISVTRVNNIYDENYNQIDTGDTVYNKARSVLYYDETAIYYGEKAAKTGKSEDQVDVVKDKKVSTVEDGYGKNYYAYTNSTYKLTFNDKQVGESVLFKSEYAQKNRIRIGDHSHTTNIIEYNGDYETQKEKIEYLDSSIYPVGAAGSSSPASTTDYAIANYWTFIPAQKKEANEDSKINIKDTNRKKLL